MSTTVSNFDVLKRLASATNPPSSLRLCTTITQMNYSAKKNGGEGGTEVTVGVPGNVCFEIDKGRKQAVLLMWDVAEFERVKREMEEEQQKADEAQAQAQQKYLEKRAEHGI